MTRTRIKICGITRPEDALFAVAAGADAIGMVFVEKSPRCVSVVQAREIVATLPALVSAVALFADATRERILQVIAEVGPTLVQFHGDESVIACADFAVPYIKALRVSQQMSSDDLLNFVSLFGADKRCRGVLFDALASANFAGHGAGFDWTKIPLPGRERMIVAGGLRADNVGKLVREVRPFAVDVSSGVESAPGVKDHRKIVEFIQAVRLADQNANG